MDDLIPPLGYRRRYPAKHKANMIWLITPSIAWFANLLLPRRIHPLLLYIAVGLICYIFLTVSILSEFSDYERDLMEFDLNGDGDFDSTELTPEALELQDKIADDTGRMFGPIFAAPITAVWVTVNFAILYGAEYGINKMFTLRQLSH